MTRRKKTIIGATILSLAVVAGMVAVMACGPNGAWGKCFHPGFHRMGFHPGPHGEDVADFILWKMDKHVKELDLNEAQRQEYEKAKGEIKTTIAEAMKRRTEFHDILKDEMSKENPDMDALASLVKERVNHLPDMVSKHIDLFMSFYNTLDGDQKAQLIEMFRRRMDL
jgi:Spy/CpxP family protein refolding chaperone